MNEKWTQYSDADQRKRNAERELKEAKAVMEDLEPQLLDMMAEEGVDRITLHGITYSPTRRLFVGPDSEKGFDKQVVAEALERSGLKDYVKMDYNANSLSGYVRAVADEHGGRDTLSTDELRSFLPQPLAAVLKVGDVWSLGSRKA